MDRTLSDSSIPSTSADWFEWLYIEERKTFDAYLAKPATLIADYIKEVATTRDYEGREILELLQNAADQAREADVKGKVVIELLPEGLIVANTGMTFSVGGVLSLETANLSPKRNKRRQYIGNKGLGFRSILNWTNEPMILSGSLALSYNRTISENKLKNLLENSDELLSLVEKEQGDTQNLIIPILPFPGYNKDGDIDKFFDDDSKVLLERCNSWRDEGYSTAIGILFDEPKYYEEARKQIDLLRPEILLFVDHLDEIRFVFSEEEEKNWSIEGTDEAAMVSENGVALGIWQIHKHEGEIPSDKLDSDQREPLYYELIVAVPESEEEDEVEVPPLFSHFPTDISLPLSVVCHATLELDQSRKHTQERESNKFVLEALAKFIAEVAERRTVQYLNGPKAGYRLLMPLKDYTAELIRAEFSEHLLEAARTREIVPTLGGKAELPDNVFYVDGANSSWLPVQIFSDVVLVESDNVDNFFKSLGISEMEDEEFNKRLLSVDDLSLDMRTALIAGLIEHTIDKSVHTSTLLLDSKGIAVPDNAIVFTSPNRTTPDMPDWITLRFLNDELRDGLNTAFDTNDVRVLQGKLSSFGLREYSLANLILRLISGANKQKEVNPSKYSEIDHDLIVTLLSLYQMEDPEQKRPSFPDNATISVKNQKGELIPINQLYLGAGYGGNGSIVQELFGSWSPEKLIVEPDILNLDIEVSECVGFLEWIGIAIWPREITLQYVNNDFLNYVVEHIIYPATFEDFGNHGYEFKCSGDVKNKGLSRILSVDGLDEIIEHCHSSAISAWLAKDERAYLWTQRRSNYGKLSSRCGSDVNNRIYNGMMPCYIRWRLENAEWLLDKEHNKHRPKDSVLGQRAIEAIFPKPAMPDKSILNNFSVSENEILQGWRHAGVSMSLAELELEDVYARLFELPTQQTDGQSARSLYHWLLDAVDSAIGDGGIARQKFFNEGKMWGYSGEQYKYFPISDLHYADNEGLPQALLDRLNLVDLRHRSGADKVKRVFGVEAIDRMSIKQRVKHSLLATDLNPEFQRVKPFLYLLRASQTSQTQHLSTLQSIQLKVCSEITAEMEFEEEYFEFQVPVWGWLIDEDVLYVCSDPAEPIDMASDLLADVVGEAIASIFRIGDGGDFARMFRCVEKDRKVLLKRMRGETASEDMEKIINEFGGQDVINQISALPIDMPIEEPVTEDNEPGIELNIDIDENEEVLLEDESSEFGDLEIEREEHIPSTATIRKKLQVKKRTGANKTHRPAHRVTDGDFTELKVMEFEEIDTPPRFPLRVGHIVGGDSLGCDILSFANSEDRKDFKSGINRDLNKVIRFIEVKGRKDEKATIELRGNERSTAATHKENYYLYRLYKIKTGQYQLSILKNPLEQKEALEPAVHVDINRAIKTEQISLSGGLQPEIS